MRQLSIAMTAWLILATAFGSPGAQDPATPCMEMSAETMFLCVNLWYNLGASSIPRHESIFLHWGDGTTTWVDLVPGRFPHTYAAAGQYTVTMQPLSGCGAGGSMNIEVSVAAAPPLPLDVSYTDGNRVIVSTTEPLDPGEPLRCSVDWGDGSPAEEFDWVACGEGALCTPSHDYAGTGEYTVRVRIEYIGAIEQPCYEREAVVQAVVGPSTPVHTSTWGAVKALYR